MNRLRLIVILFVALAMIPTFVNAQLFFNGNRGLNYVHSAWNLEPGFMTLKLYSRGFGTVSNDPVIGSINIWDITGRANINYGVSKHFGVNLTPLLYEDTNRAGVNTPGDVFLSLKFGSFGSAGSPLAYGFLLNTKFPLGSVHNIPFEPYTAKRIGFGATGILTYSRDALYPEEAMNIHLNIGYWNHNDVGVELIEGNSLTKTGSMSQEILYALGVVVPKDKFDFSAEIYGNTFVQAPPPAAYSREGYLYFSPSVSYDLLHWMTLSLGADLRIMSSGDQTLYSPAAGGVPRTLADSQPNYPGWRINFGTHFSLLPTGMRRADDRDILLQKAESRRELFEKIINEQRATESAEAELERIKAERIRAEKELERLRRILEGELQKDKKKLEKENENNENQ